MKKTILTCILFFTFLGCSRWYEEFELNENSFDSDAMQYIEEISGLDLPENANGLKFYYKPPIDPCFIAKIEIAATDKQTIEKQIKGFKAYDSVPVLGREWNFRDWWPEKIDNEIVSKIYYREDSGYIFAYLIKEKEQLILYLKHITI